MNYIEAYTKGVSCFEAARRTKNRKYAKIGQQIRRRVKNWIAKGNPNLGHVDILLEAEHAALKRKPSLARQKFELAVFLSARSGLMLDAGLASELFGEYCLELGDVGDATFHLKDAIKFYTDVGAAGKVRQLSVKYSDLLPRPTEVISHPPSHDSKELELTPE